jgi:hypothetical protein
MIAGFRHFERDPAARTLGRVPLFLVELYAARSDECAAACAQRSVDGVEGLRCLYSIFVPEDETCLLVVEAASPERVRELLRGGGLAYDRVAAAVSG